MGWCCQEHAIVACYAFALAGRRTLYCDGKLIILTRQSDEVYEVLPHVFLVDDSRNVFDSSISFDGVEGIAMSKQKPMPGVKVTAGRSHPPIEQLYDQLMRSSFSRLFVYTAEHPQLLLPPLGKPNGSPFSEWLEETFGSQPGLMGKTSWFVHNALNGTPPILGDSREAMWEAIIASPDRDELVGQALLNLKT